MIVRRRAGGPRSIVFIIITVLLIASLSLCAYLAFSLLSGEREYQAFRELSESDFSGLSEDVEDITKKAQRLEQERNNLAARVAELESERDIMLENFSDSDTRYETLNESIAAMKANLSFKDAEITELKNNIKKLENVYSVDINKQFEILRELGELLENPPLTEVEVEVTNEDGTTEIVVEMIQPRISLYYEDIGKGYKYSFNENEVYQSASCIKAPLALSILQAAQLEYDSVQAAIEAAAESGLAPPETQLNYDLENNTLTYTKEMYQSGSGKIKDEPEGKEYTHLELLKYMLMYSDNVAYNELKDIYGITNFRSLVSKIGAKSMQRSLSNITGVDGGKVMRAIYDFIAEGGHYADFMYESMTNSAHSVMIGYSVYPRKVAHKYGWDVGSYHDIGIVYDANPYIIVFLSDMDKGGEEINEYIQSVIKLVAKLHANFYSKA